MAKNPIIEEIDNLNNKQIQEIDDMINTNTSEPTSDVASVSVVTTVSEAGSITEPDSNQTAASEGGSASETAPVIEERSAPEASSNSTSTDNDSSTSEPAPEKEDNSSKESSSLPKPKRVPDGISRAYDDLSFGEYDAKPKKTTKKESSKPPKRNKGKEVKGSNFMEMIWNEFMGLYSDMIDFVVDTSLDFTEWVLFAPFTAGDVIADEKLSRLENIYSFGEQIYKKRTATLDKNHELFKNAHTELANNLKKATAGEALEWKVWDKEPDFFKQLSKIYEVAQNDSNSEEAKIIERFNKTPKIIEGLLNKEKTVYRASMRLATLEEVMDKDFKIVSPEINDDFVKLEKDLGDKSIDIKVLSSDVKNILSKLNEGSPLEQKIIKNLEKMQDVLASDVKDESKIKKSIKSELKEIKESCKSGEGFNEVTSQKIIDRSKVHYDKIMGNLDKIEEKYNDDPSLIRKYSREYMEHIAKNVKDAKKQIDKTDEGIWSKIPLCVEKSKELLHNAVSSVDNYVFVGKAISGQEKAKEKGECPLLGDKAKILRAVKNYGMGA